MYFEDDRLVGFVARSANSGAAIDAVNKLMRVSHQYTAYSQVTKNRDRAEVASSGATFIVSVSKVDRMMAHLRVMARLIKAKDETLRIRIEGPKTPKKRISETRAQFMSAKPVSQG